MLVHASRFRVANSRAWWLRASSTPSAATTDSTSRTISPEMTARSEQKPGAAAGIGPPARVVVETSTGATVVETSTGATVVETSTGATVVGADSATAPMVELGATSSGPTVVGVGTVSAAPPHATVVARTATTAVRRATTRNRRVNPIRR